jgi:hypothetical protein
MTPPLEDDVGLGLDRSGVVDEVVFGTRGLTGAPVLPDGRFRGSVTVKQIRTNAGRDLVRGIALVQSQAAVTIRPFFLKPVHHSVMALEHWR